MGIDRIESCDNSFSCEVIEVDESDKRWLSRCETLVGRWYRDKGVRSCQVGPDPEVAFDAVINA